MYWQVASVANRASSPIIYCFRLLKLQSWSRRFIILSGGGDLFQTLEEDAVTNRVAGFTCKRVLNKHSQSVTGRLLFDPLLQLNHRYHVTRRSFNISPWSVSTRISMFLCLHRLRFDAVIKITVRRACTIINAITALLLNEKLGL